MAKNNKEVRQVFFKFYDDYAENYVQFLTGEQLKALMLALVDFHRDGVIADFSHEPVVNMAFNAICGNIVRDEKKYMDAIERKKAQREREEAKKAEEERKRKEAEKAKLPFGGMEF